MKYYVLWTEFDYLNNAIHGKLLVDTLAEALEFADGLWDSFEMGLKITAIQIKPEYQVTK
jgi:hypothetical protein